MNAAQRTGLTLLAGAVLGVCIGWGIAAGAASGTRDDAVLKEAQRAVAIAKLDATEPEGVWDVTTFRITDNTSIVAKVAATVGRGTFTVTCELGAYKIAIAWPDVTRAPGYFPRLTRLAVAIDGDETTALPFLQELPYDFAIEGARAHALVAKLNDHAQTLRISAESGEEASFPVAGFRTVAKQFSQHCKPVDLDPFHQRSLPLEVSANM